MARTPEEETYWRQQVARQQAEEEQSRAAMTPAGQQGGVALGLVEQAPGMVALGAPMLAAGPFAPLVGAGLMAAQSRGDIYNRLVQQGITPPPEALNAAEIAMTPSIRA